MGKCKLQYRCGHTATVWVFGKEEVRESYLEWTRRNESCPACRREALALGRPEPFKTAAAVAK